MTASNQLNIEINVCCDIPIEKVNLFADLLQKLLNYVHPNKLRKIILVPDNQVAETVNQILNAAVGISEAYKPRSVLAANAVSIPVEGENDLACFIILGDGLIQQLTPDHMHVPEVVSAVLEELLHVWHYSMIWNRRGYIHYGQKVSESCTADLYTIASQMLDEYVVNNTKMDILSTVPLIEVEPGQGLTTGLLSYGDSIKNHLDHAAESMKQVVVGAAAGEMPISDAWPHMLHHLYRDILEPLARDTAFRIGTSEELLTEQEASLCSFYHHFFASYWGKIRSELVRTVSSNLAETEQALEEIVKHLRAFLELIGVTYHLQDDEICWVDFHSGFFDRLKE